MRSTLLVLMVFFALAPLTGANARPQGWYLGLDGGWTALDSVGYALALFQMSTLITVFLGYHLFAEKHFVERMVGSIIMVAGAVLVIYGG